MDPGWSRLPWGYEVESRDEMFRAISRLGTLESGRRYVWRGVPSRHFSVRSSLLRDLVGPDDPVPPEAEVRARELEILAVARRWGISMKLVSSRQTSISLLCSSIMDSLHGCWTSPVTQPLRFGSHPNARRDRETHQASYWLST